jgi:hypothetical protein
MLLDLFQPDIAKGDLAGPGAGTLQRNQAVRFELAVIIVVEDSRDVTVENLGDHMTACDEVDLIPVVDLEVPAEFLSGAKRGEQAGRFAGLCLHNLAATDEDGCGW